MFNKSASDDFQQRLRKHNLSPKVEVKTFHALGLKTVSFLERKGLLQSAQLVDKSSFLEKLTREALQKTHHFIKIKESITPELIDRYQQYVSLLKSSLVLSKTIKQINEIEQVKVEMFFRFYEQLRASYRWRTFDDLLYEPMQVLSKNKGLASRFGNRYRYVIVDEYQDINDVQQAWLKIIASNAQSVMVVGDVDQTIYEWRGSKPYYMLKGFSVDFKGVKRYTLSMTFRYGHLLSVMANEVIQHNQQRLKTFCFSAPHAAKKTDVNILSKKYLSLLVKELANDLKNKCYQSEDVVVLVRKYSAAVLLELACLEQSVAYHIAGGKSVFKLLITQAIFAYLQLFDNAKCFKQLATNECQARINTILLLPNLYLNMAQLQSLSQLLSEYLTEPYKALAIFNKQHDLPFYQLQRLQERMGVWQSMLKVRSGESAKTVMCRLYELLDLKTYLAKQSVVNPVYADGDVADAWLNFSMQKDDTIESFIDQFQILESQAKTTKSGKKGLLISSIHKAKGLQWQHVILCDMTEQSFFSNTKDKAPSIEEIESERRLFYVAITRAISKLSIIAGNDIAKLNKWFAEGVSGFPLGLRKTNSVRFLYESHLQGCEEILQVAFGEVSDMSLSNTKQGSQMSNYLQRLLAKR